MKWKKLSLKGISLKTQETKEIELFGGLEIPQEHIKRSPKAESAPCFLRTQLTNSHSWDVLSEPARLGFWDLDRQFSLRFLSSRWHQDRRSLWGSFTQCLGSTIETSFLSIKQGRWSLLEEDPRHLSGQRPPVMEVGLPPAMVCWVQALGSVQTQLTSMSASWSGSSRFLDWFSRDITSVSKLRTNEEMD